MGFLKNSLSLAAVLALGVGISANASNADSVAKFYKGKTLKVIVASSAG